MRVLRRALVAIAVLAALSPVPAHASGETLTAAPSSGAPGAAVRLDYETNYGPGGCEGGQVVQLFFDASPLASARMDPSRCGAARTVRVPSGSCGRHVFRAAWRTGQDPTLYGEATAAFVVRCTAPLPPSRAPQPRAAPTPRGARTAVTAAPRPARSAPPTAAPVVPVVTTPATPAAVAEQDEGGTPWWVWLLIVIGTLGAAVAARRRWNS